MRTSLGKRTGRLSWKVVLRFPKTGRLATGFCFLQQSVRTATGLGWWANKPTPAVSFRAGGSVIWLEVRMEVALVGGVDGCGWKTLPAVTKTKTKNRLWEKSYLQLKTIYKLKRLELLAMLKELVFKENTEYGGLTLPDHLQTNDRSNNSDHQMPKKNNDAKEREQKKQCHRNLSAIGQRKSIARM